ncbi:type 1 glutamine amidotransferase [Uliginosibacterium sp. sgz301328]|uniref:type 1 glutamine amidotransferase n=1 Tax=Uliginosibacterium sp. sgz301328 TaxID=3243764 RepID=UPI00359D1EE9
MKPIAIFQHCQNVQPGHFASFLDRHSIPWTLVRVDEGAPIPERVGAFSGLCFMGGPMSVNDDLPWIERELDLIRHAIDSSVPVIGHCLGGQLMSRALGGEVTRNPVREIGWTRITATDTPHARQWLGDVRGFDAYQWHGETFTIPAGATRILEGENCTNQAYVLGPGEGIHLGMQFHIEMTEALIRNWTHEWSREFERTPLPATTQLPASQFEQMRVALPAQLAIADRLYTRWIAALAG